MSNGVCMEICGRKRSREVDSQIDKWGVFRDTGQGTAQRLDNPVRSPPEDAVPLIV